MVRSNVGTAQRNNGTVKFENKKQGTTECDKNRVDAMLVLLNVTMELSNLRKNKETTICDKRIVKFDIGTALSDNETIKFESQIKEPLNITE